MVKKRNRKNKDVFGLISVLVIILLLNFIASFYFKRFDLTSEKRYTLANSTITLLKNLPEEVNVKVYLNGDFNPGFARLKNETREILDQFRAYSKDNLHYEFINLGESLTKEETNNLEKQLYGKGLIPENITIRSKEKTTDVTIFPGAIISYKGKETIWQIFNRQSPGIAPEVCINNSIEELEYSLTNCIRKLQRDKKAEVTFLFGQHELDTIQQYDFMRCLAEYYSVNNVKISAGHELHSLQGTDALIISAPDTSFSEKQKYIIDQFIMRGGKVLWLIDPISLNRDSLRKGFSIGINRPLDIEDMLFKYGVRLNPVLVQDMQCGYLKINTGFQRGQAKFEMFPWLYTPLILPNKDHPIVKNLDLIKFEFASTLDTISARGIKKTILLKTSRYTRTQPAPARVSLAMVKMRQRESQFSNSYQNVACLLEGSFHSFAEFLIPDVLLRDSNFKFVNVSKPTKMIVVADGDLARNEFNSATGQIYPLGFDRNTQQTFANKTFLLNCVNYLLDDEGLLLLRSREVKLRLLDKKKVNTQRGQWQMVNLLFPILFMVLIGVGGYYWRRRQFL